MSDFPVRLLVRGYGAAAMAAAVGVGLGAGPLAALAVFWLGGPVAVLTLAGVAFARDPHAGARPEDPSLAEDLAQWEADRAEDAPSLPKTTAPRAMRP